MTELLVRAVRHIEMSVARIGKSFSSRYAPLTHSSRRSS